VIGAILFERTMDGEVDGKPTPAGADRPGVVPFIKIDKGLEDEENGVQMMKPMPGARRAARARQGLGVFGTKERSVINLANRAGIAARRAAVRGRRQVLAHGMVPIIEPEVNIKSPSAPRPTGSCSTKSSKGLDEIPDGQRVMLKLSIPASPGLFAAAGRSSQGAARRRAVRRLQPREACRELAKNPA
jgi:fructose-bisphosphate aldolase class I